MTQLKTLTAACLMLCTTAAVAAPNSNTPQSNAVINRIDSTKNFVQDRFTLDATFRVRADGGDTGAQYAGVNNPASRTESHLNAEFWLGARVYKDWTIKMQVEPQYNFRTGKMNGDDDVPMNKLFVEGTLYDKVKLRAGKFGAFSSYGRVFDNEVTGAELTFDYAVPTKLTVARLTKLNFNDHGGFKYGNADAGSVGVHRNPTVILQSKYPLGLNTNIGGTVAYVKDVTHPSGTEKDAWFGEVGVDTKFTPDISGFIAYSRSNIDDIQDTRGKKVSPDGVFAEVKYKNADWATPQSYDVYLNLRRVGAMSGVSSVSDYSKNVQGIQIGADYVPYKNVKLGAFYLLGKQVNATAPDGEKNNVNVWRAQAEYKF